MQTIAILNIGTPVAPMWEPEQLQSELARLQREEAPVSRETLHQALMQFAHPLSPFDDLNSKERCRKPWYTAARWSWLDILLDIAKNPPLEDKYHPSFADAWDVEVSELTVHIGRQNPAACLDKLRPLLNSREGRGVAISAITVLGTPAERELYLAPLLISFSLSEDDVNTLAEAFVNVPTPEAWARFQEMRAFLSRDWTETLNYLDELNTRFGGSKR